MQRLQMPVCFIHFTHQGIWCHTMSQSWNLDSAAPSGAFSKQSPEKWRTLPKSVYFVWKGFIKLAMLLCSVSSEWDCTAEKAHNDWHPRGQWKVECFQVAKRTAVCQQHLFCSPKQNRSSKCFSLSSRTSIVLDFFCSQISLWTHVAAY